MTHDLTEIWVALRAALLADTTLAGLLASNTALYRGEPHFTAASPHLVMQTVADNPIGGRSFTGLWRPEISIAIYAVDRDRTEAIKARLDAAWQIPINRATEVASTNLRLTSLRRTALSGPTPVQVVNTNESLFQLVTFWATRVINKS